MLVDEHLPMAIGNTSSWKFGEDRPGNGKLAWWADSPSGGGLTFPIRTTRHPPMIGVGFLSSWDPMMGAARFSIVGDPAGWSVVIDASRSTEPRISVSSFEQLCVQLADVTVSSNFSYAHRRKLVKHRPPQGSNISHVEPKMSLPCPNATLQREVLPALPPCRKKIHAKTNGILPDHEALSQMHEVLSQEQVFPEEDRLLHVELIPAPTKKENKFAIRYITSC